MTIEAFSHPKARDLSVPSDDVLLHIPGRITGVFDGASDSLGRRINNVPVGRLAAMAAAQAAAELPIEAAHWPAKDILVKLSRAIAAYVPIAAGDGPASTTAMIAFEMDDCLRMLGIGDTGYRINGGQIMISELAPDRVTIPTRVSLFELFLQQGMTLENCEATSRDCIGKGLLWAVNSETLTQAEADAIAQNTLDELGMPSAAEEADHLIRHGLRSQYRLANAADAQLGYGVLNGSEPAMGHAIDKTIPFTELTSIEIFSDGYLNAPPSVSIEAWEGWHADLEVTDPHKIRKLPAVKGSTEAAFFDDRTVAILRFPTNDGAGNP